MYKLTVMIHGVDDEELICCLEEVLRKMKDGSTSGLDQRSGGSGKYVFYVGSVSS